MTIIKVPNEAAIIKELASLIQKHSKDAISNRGRFFIGLSGGSVIKFLTEALQTIETDFSKWTLAFCDERVVPEESDDSTFGAYKRELIPKCKLKEEQFVKIKQGVSAQEAAEDYTTKLRDAFGSSSFIFDLLLLGMGPDGHTCSLFPGHPLLEETKPVAAIIDSPKPPPQRVTLTLPVVNAARGAVFAASGASKADMVKRILKDKEDLPAGRVNPTSGAIYWILDEGAASLL